MSEQAPVAPVISEEDDYAAWERGEAPPITAKDIEVEPSDKTPKGGEQSRTETASPTGEDEKEPEHLSEPQKANWRALRQQAKEGKAAKEELERLKRTAAPPAPTTETRQPERTSEAPKPFTDPEPILDNFDSIPEWKQSHDEWKEKFKAATKAEAAYETRQNFYRERLEQAQRAEADEAKRLGGLFSAKAEALKKDAAFADMDEVLRDNNTPMTNAMFQFYAEDDHGARVAYHMATHPVEALNISMLPPSRQTKALEDLRDTLIDAPKETKSETPPRKTYKPPSRANPGGSVPSNDPLDTDPDDYKEFERRWDEQRSRRV